jgi:hypothetical protein
MYILIALRSLNRLRPKCVLYLVVLLDLCNSSPRDVKDNIVQQSMKECRPVAPEPWPHRGEQGLKMLPRLLFSEFDLDL